MTKRIIFEGPTNCPYCKKKIKVRVERETITPGTKAETETLIEVQEDTQTELG